MSKAAYRFVLRPGRSSDIAAVAALWNRHAVSRGQPDGYSAKDVEHRWSTPGFTAETDTTLAWVGADLVGYAQLRDVKEPHVDLFVGLTIDPDLEDADPLSDVLFAWIDERGRASLPRAPEDARVVLVAGAGGDDIRLQDLLVRHGFQLDRVFSRLRLDFEARPPAAAWPDGIAVRTFRPGQDDVDLVRGYRDAFQDHYGYLEQPLEVEVERWRHWIREPDFSADLWLLALDGTEVCGFCCSYAESHGDGECGLVDEFGVRPKWRRRGIGRALLLESFGAIYDCGRKAVELTVDSRSASDALGVYASVGMRPVDRNHTYVKELRAGRNLVVS
ncbi:MAG: GNAT family N-acetyltransferase [Candidatus Bipolaricaulis sp.]|nr:GNAT family N-acetyltransferase [Candidatus Bipolaricaulis sp.]